MKLKLEKPQLLKNLVNILDSSILEAKIRVDKKGLYLLEMDPANVMMSEVNLLKAAFKEYKIKKPFDFGVNIGILKERLSIVESKDILTLEIKNKELPNDLIITIQGKYKKVLKVPLIEIESDHKYPELDDIKAKIVIPSKDFKNIIKDFCKIDDRVEFICDKNLTIHSEKLDIPIKSSKDIKITKKGSGKVASKYSLEYLKHIIKADILSKEVIIEFNTDYPAIFTYSVKDEFSLKLILAPRVTSE